jgi:hypothetical protein
MPSCLKYTVNNYVSKCYRAYFLNSTSLKFSDCKTFSIKYLVHTTCSLDIHYIVCFWSQQWMLTTAYSVHQCIQVKNEYMSCYKNYVLVTVKTYFCVLWETQQGKYVTWSTRYLHFIITAVHVKEMWPHLLHTWIAQCWYNWIQVTMAQLTTIPLWWFMITWYWHYFS